MKRLLTATVACIALSLPAMAQSTSTGTSSGGSMGQGQSMGSGTSQSQDQYNSGTQSQSGSQMQDQTGQQQAGMIQPSDLSKKEIKQIQSKLNKAGYSAKKVDGVWGKNTEAALRDYQQSKNLPGNGELNQETLASLGVNANR